MLSQFADPRPLSTTNDTVVYKLHQSGKAFIQQAVQRINWLLLYTPCRTQMTWLHYLTKLLIKSSITLWYDMLHDNILVISRGPPNISGTWSDVVSLPGATESCLSTVIRPIATKFSASPGDCVETTTRTNFRVYANLTRIDGGNQVKGYFTYCHCKTKLVLHIDRAIFCSVWKICHFCVSFNYQKRFFFIRNSVAMDAAILTRI